MGVEEVVTRWVKKISVEICNNSLNNRKRPMGLGTRKYIRWSSKTTALQVPVYLLLVITVTSSAGVSCTRYFIKKTLFKKISVNHMWQACRNCQIKVIDLWRLRSHVSLTNFKPHLICVAMSKSTSSTMPVTEVQVFLICFRFSPSKFYPDVAFYFLNLRGIFFTYN